VEPAVSRLNELLPKRQFIFMGPGGGKAGGGACIGGDIQYVDIDNAKLLVELIQQADERGNDVSVGIHFLLDLMESNIRYLPLFLEEEPSSINTRFLMRSDNVLSELLPEYAFLEETVRVIDVRKSSGGKVLKILMNAELSEAVAVLTDPEEEWERSEHGETLEEGHPESYWRWRYRMAEQIASHLDSERFGVAGCYLFGSAKNGTAGPASDIDILVHFKGTTEQRAAMTQWLEGWSLCLDEINYLRTGYRSGGLLDAHLVTDEDIAKKTSYAVKINAVTDAAHPLPIKQSGQPISETRELATREGAN
jgi:hypothetical protein